MLYLQLKDFIKNNNLNELLSKTICDSNVESEKQRYLTLLDNAYKLFGDGDYHFVSSPGRSEIGGNHTDHQHGHVLAAALSLDNVCVFKANNSNTINYIYDGNKKVSVDISNLEMIEKEKNTSNSLIRGIASRFNQLSYAIGGFDAICDSKVLVGSGISSSACFEVMIVEILNHLFNNGFVNDVDRAIISQYAEREYFGKPCGLMDQMAISVGGFVAIDFKNVNKPEIENYEFSFSDFGYELLLINTKGDHADLSHEYAAVPNEMKQVAHLLGVEVLADTSLQELMLKFNEIRDELKNDRALLRAMHFFTEDKRAIEEKNAVKNKEISALLKLMKESGQSSYMYLQNVYPASRPTSQALAIGLCLSANFLNDEGTYRVHGGGFDGTIQVVIKSDKVDEYKKLMNNVFGNDSIISLKVRNFGTKTLI